eukprot:GHVR01176625.1.p1 GENE.GHVR01176625.1~~GHVR01176625.1.p1  ORF type:complete len:179 (+),score=78.39 GHVR01176625.1:176-712(+)
MSKFSYSEYLFPAIVDGDRLSGYLKGTCGACLFDIKENDTQTETRRTRRDLKIGVIDCCSHYFHYKCISFWVNRDSSCPQCKSSVKQLCSYSYQGEKLSLRPVVEVNQNFEDETDESDDYTHTHTHTDTHTHADTHTDTHNNNINGCSDTETITPFNNSSSNREAIPSRVVCVCVCVC